MAEKIVLVPTAKNNSNTQRTDYSMYINQGGAALKWAYTRTNPNGLPEAVQVTVMDEKTKEMKPAWDFTEQQNFFIAKVNEVRTLLPNRRLQESRENTAAAQGAPAPGAADDLPF